MSTLLVNFMYFGENVRVIYEKVYNIYNIEAA
jgi:hypothetical protein